MTDTLQEEKQQQQQSDYLRFPLATRILHWVAVISVFVLLWSGMMVFNIHPRLYWGEVGYFGAPAVAELVGDTATDPPQIELRIGSLSMDVTGIMGRINRQPYIRIFGYPEDFAFGENRALHFTAAWALVLAWLYYTYHLVDSGRLKDTWMPRAHELSPRYIGQDILNHLKFRRAKGAAVKQYNILQKLSYLGVMFVLMPLIFLTGLAMSNSVSTAWPFLFDLFGGRQSARTLHFIFISLLMLFVIVHVVQVFVAGFVNHFRSMITGRFKLEEEAH